METTITKLLRVLEREGELFKLMLTVMVKESQAAVQSDLKALATAGEEKEKILRKLRPIEEQRIQLVRDMAETLGHPTKDISITKIAQLVDEPFAGRLRQAGSDLSTVLNSVKDSSNRNKQVFAHSLELIRGSFNLLSAFSQSNTVYHRTGNIQSTFQTGKCVNGEI